MKRLIATIHRRPLSVSNGPHRGSRATVPECTFRISATQAKSLSFRWCYTVTVGIVFLVLSRAGAAADPVTLLDDGRRVAVTVGAESRELLAADVLSVNATSSGVYATVTAIGDITDLHRLSGLASASIESTGSVILNASAGANFLAIFTLHTPHVYRFNLRSSSGQGYAFLRGYIPNVGLSSGDYFGGHFFDEEEVFESSRYLDIGTYWFEVAAGVGGASWPPGSRVSASYDFTFELDNATIPEPGSILLLGSGLVGLALRRRMGVLS